MHEFGAPAPDLPYVRNYYKNETADAIARPTTCRRCSGGNRYDVVHAQHVMTTLAAIDAAEGAPACRWSPRCATTGRSATGRICCTRASGLELCPACSAGKMRMCIRPRAGALWPLALPMIPYMRANLAAKRTGWRVPTP